MGSLEELLTSSLILFVCTKKMGFSGGKLRVGDKEGSGVGGSDGGGGGQQ